MKLGRPEVPKNEQKEEVFSVRVSRDESKAIWAAIDASGKKKPVWMREALLRCAKLKK